MKRHCRLVILRDGLNRLWSRMAPSCAWLARWRSERVASRYLPGPTTTPDADRASQTGHRRLKQFLSLLCFLLALPAFSAVTPGSSLRAYTSEIDGSQQPYGLYIPNPFHAATPHPVIFTGHGFGGHANASFSAYQQTFANTYGFILVKLEGRGNTFFDGVGEEDFLAVLRELRALFLLDERRLYLEGASMGATGAYRIGFHFPDVLAAVGGADGWGDYRYWHRHWYAPTRDPYYIEPFRVPNLEMASCTDIAERAKWQRLYMIVDTQDSTVWPENTYNVRVRLLDLGSMTEEDDYLSVEQRNTGGHCAGYSQPTLYEYFRGQTLVTAPRHVTVTTTRLKYGKVYWARIDSMPRVNAMALIDARMTGNDIAITTDNVGQYTLFLDETLVDTAQPVAITTDGMPSYLGPAATVTLYATRNAAGSITGWSTLETSCGGLRKRAGLEGPIGDAYTSRFLVVYGTAGSTAETDANLAEANVFCGNWNTWMGAAITPKPDTSVSAMDIATSNLMLFGTAQSNALIGSMQNGLPITVADTGISIGSRRYLGANFGAYFVYPNPLNPARYVVISHKIVPGSCAKDLEALPWYWPDYVIFDTNRTPGACVQASLAYLPDTFVEAGYFESDWQLAPEPLSAVQLHIDPANKQRVGEAVTLTATPTGGKTVEYRYFVSCNGGAYTQLRRYAADPQYVYTPTAPGSSTFLVWAREVGHTTTKDAYTTIKCTVTSPITAVSLAASPASPQPTLTPMVLTASATGGANVQYRFFVYVENAWITIQPYGLARTCAYTPQKPGAYTFLVWARELGSSNGKDAYATITYQVAGGEPLSAVRLRVDPVSPGSVGNQVSLTATPTGGNTVEYRFFVSENGGAYTQLRRYTTAETFTYTPAVAGRYTFLVWARETGHTTTKDCYTLLTYEAQ